MASSPHTHTPPHPPPAPPPPLLSMAPPGPAGPKALQYWSALTPLSLHVIGTQRGTRRKLDWESEGEGKRDAKYTKKRGKIPTMQDSFMTPKSKKMLARILFFKYEHCCHSMSNAGKHPFEASLPSTLVRCTKHCATSFIFMSEEIL